MFQLNQPTIKNQVQTWSRDLTGRQSGRFQHRVGPEITLQPSRD